jgi:hypothetical protein
MARRHELDRPQPLRIVEDMEGFGCLLPDPEATGTLQRRNLYFHLAMMACFLTVFLAPFAWLAALGSIVLSAQRASWKLRCTAHGVELEHLYTRSEPGVAELNGEKATKGPLPMGFGQAEPPERVLFSEMDAVEWNDYALVFRMAGGARRELRLERTSREDIARLGARIRAVFEGYHAGQTVSREEAERDRKKLAAMAAASRGVRG